jgi:hypothetical protein
MVMGKHNKVENSSKYWADFEGELSIYYHLKWTGESSVRKFISNELYFFKKYMSLAHKYGVVVPNCNEYNLFEAYQEYSLRNETNGIKSNYFIYYMYDYNKNNLVYPTILFTDLNKKKPITIINIDPFTELKDIETVSVNFGAVPLRVESWEKGTNFEIICYIDNDIFNLELYNKKTKYEFDNFVDNSELAYLNTPRLNSFLRDLKKLCFEYGATGFEFENLGLNDFCEDGVMFNGEVIYYEDVVDLLLPEHRIVK